MSTHAKALVARKSHRRIPIDLRRFVRGIDVSRMFSVGLAGSGASGAGLAACHYGRRQEWRWSHATPAFPGGVSARSLTHTRCGEYPIANDLTIVKPITRSKTLELAAEASDAAAAVSSSDRDLT